MKRLRRGGSREDGPRWGEKILFGFSFAFGLVGRKMLVLVAKGSLARFLVTFDLLR